MSEVAKAKLISRLKTLGTRLEDELGAVRVPRGYPMDYMKQFKALCDILPHIEDDDTTRLKEVEKYIVTLEEGFSVLLKEHAHAFRTLQ